MFPFSVFWIFDQLLLGYYVLLLLGYCVNLALGYCVIWLSGSYVKNSYLIDI